MTTETQTHDHYTARCPGCKRYARLYIHHGRVSGQYGYWLACPACDWTQDGCHKTITAALQAYEDTPLRMFTPSPQPAPPPPASPPAPPCLGLGQAERYVVAVERMAAAAEQQAADTRAIRECLETLLDTMAAEVQP